MKNLDSIKQQGDVIWNITNLLRGPYRKDAWIGHSKAKVSCEIPFNRHFYEYEPPHPLDWIEADLLGLKRAIMAMLKDVTG